MNRHEFNQSLEKMKRDPLTTIRAAVGFGMHLAEAANDLAVSSTSPDKAAAILAKIANGEYTFVPGGAEVLQKLPNAPEDVESILAENRKIDQAFACLFSPEFNQRR
jgi:hypothetical protein